MPMPADATPSTGDPRPSVREEYETHGADGYYAQFGADYRNPHEDVVGKVLVDAAARWSLDLSHVLDLAAGSGEATLVLRSLGAKRIDGIDPFTREAYLRRTGSIAEGFTFADIAAGALAGRRYSLIACSFAMHLCEPSRLPGLLYNLAQVSAAMLIISPHKRPVLRSEWGWSLTGHTLIERVHSRFYQTTPAR